MIYAYPTFHRAIEDAVAIFIDGHRSGVDLFPFRVPT